MVFTYYQGNNFFDRHELDSVWLVAPLISKLNSMVQGKVLKAAGQVLETGNNFWSAKNSKDKERHLQKRLDKLFYKHIFCIIHIHVFGMHIVYEQ